MTERLWREVTATEAIAFANGKRVVGGEDGYGQSMVTSFDDGSALRVTVEEGTVYSEWTADSARIVIEIAES